MVTSDSMLSITGSLIDEEASDEDESDEANAFEFLLS